MAYGIAEEGGIRLNLDRLGLLHWIGIALAVLTGTIHVFLYLDEGFLPFALAGVGFYAAVVLLLHNVNRVYLYPLGILFTIGQIAGFLAIDGNWDALAILDKAVQVALVAVLAYLHYAEVMDRGERTVVGRTKSA